MKDYTELLARVDRIVVSSLVALMDSIDTVSPEMLMERAISEIDGTIRDIANALNDIAAYHNFVRIRLIEEKRKLEALNARLVEKASQDREDEAVVVIGRQMDIEIQLPVFDRLLDHCDETMQALTKNRQILQAKKREMQEELRLYRADNAEDNTTAAARQGMAATLREIPSLFDFMVNEQTRVSDMSGTQERRNLRKMLELAEVSRTNLIRERLAVTKAHVRDLEPEEEDADVE